MFSIEKYIEQELPGGAYYSETLFMAGAASGATNAAQYNGANDGAKYVYLQKLIVQSQIFAAPSVGTIVDGKGNILLSWNLNGGSISNSYDVDAIYKGNALRIVSSSLLVNFTAIFQYITRKQ